MISCAISITISVVSMVLSIGGALWFRRQFHELRDKYKSAAAVPPPQ